MIALRCQFGIVGGLAVEIGVFYYEKPIKRLVGFIDVFVPLCRPCLALSGIVAEVSAAYARGRATEYGTVGVIPRRLITAASVFCRAVDYGGEGVGRAVHGCLVSRDIHLRHFMVARYRIERYTHFPLVAVGCETAVVHWYLDHYLSLRAVTLCRQPFGRV